MTISRTITPNYHGYGYLKLVVDSEGVERIVAQREDPPLAGIVAVPLAYDESLEVAIEFEWPEGNE